MDKGDGKTSKLLKGTTCFSSLKIIDGVNLGIDIFLRNLSFKWIANLSILTNTIFTQDPRQNTVEVF